jgi:hypothetical protein
MAILRQMIAEGFHSFDLLRGNEPYKMHWRAEPRPTVDICVLPGKATDRFRYSMWLAGDAMRSWLRSHNRELSHWTSNEGESPWLNESVESGFTSSSFAHELLEEQS